jgi:hypothetical protein
MAWRTNQTKCTRKCSPRTNWNEVLTELGPETQNRRYAVSSHNTRDLPTTKQLCTKQHTRFQLETRGREDTDRNMAAKCKARGGSREMEQHVKQFGETYREQRAKATAKERDLLEQEIAPALKAHFVSQETIKNRSSTSGGVRYTVPVTASQVKRRCDLD